MYVYSPKDPRPIRGFGSNNHVFQPVMVSGSEASNTVVGTWTCWAIPGPGRREIERGTKRERERERVAAGVLCEVSEALAASPWALLQQQCAVPIKKRKCPFATLAASRITNGMVPDS